MSPTKPEKRAAPTDAAAPAKKAKPAPAPTYRVVYRMWDHHNGADSPHDETVGRYASLADAQARVRSYLLEQWDEDFFDSYEEEEGDDGELEVYAQCPEGEEMWVFWEEEEALQRGVIGECGHGQAETDLTGSDEEEEARTVYIPVEVGTDGERRIGSTAYSQLRAAYEAARRRALELDPSAPEVSDSEPYSHSVGEGEEKTTVTVVQLDVE